MNQLKDRPFALLGIHGNGYEPKQLKAVMEKEKLNWRSIADQSVITTRWSARGIPAYYVIDHQGVIRHKWFGYPGVKPIDGALHTLVEKAEGK